MGNLNLYIIMGNNILIIPLGIDKTMEGYMAIFPSFKSCCLSILY
jgi:hypothetical protein